MTEDRVQVLIPQEGLAGIYFLYWKGQLSYIGKSVNVYYRIAKHHNNMLRRRRGLVRGLDDKDESFYLDFDRVEIEFCRAEEITRKESLAIQRYRPPNNVLLNRDPPKGLDQIQETDWFKALEAKADAASPDVKKRKFNGTSRPIARKYNKVDPRWREVRERMGA